LAACPTCSKASPDGSRFCPFCGGKLAALARKVQDPLVGQVIDDKYVILERIGTGAMGSIYRAEQRALSKQIALKVLHRHLLTEESQVKRFHREAKAASRLNHPNAIVMLDFGRTPDGLTYIAMEFLPGKDLCRLLFEEKHLSEDRMVRIVLQILDALDEAHTMGVIHRDLKPENVMIEPLRSNPDFVKVLDFGIAKIRDGVGAEDSSFKTATGMVFGTPEYMSPEQIRGEELDGRSDLYSLGVLMYQMVSGELPFTGESVLEVATAHLTRPAVSLAEKVPGITPGVASLIASLMAKKRDDRPVNAVVARNALMAARGAAAQAATDRPLQVGGKADFLVPDASFARAAIEPAVFGVPHGFTSRWEALWSTPTREPRAFPAEPSSIEPVGRSWSINWKTMLLMGAAALAIGAVVVWAWIWHEQ
jgi:serine/threonine-protein kinase